MGAAADAGEAPPPTVDGADPASVITGYDIQVMDPAGSVVSTLTATEPQTTVTGLANGSGYRFQVRARNSHGAGPWSATGVTTPLGVPGGAARFTEAIRQFITSREG